MNPILCLAFAIIALAKSANGGDADSKGSEAAKLLVSKQVRFIAQTAWELPSLQKIQ